MQKLILVRTYNMLIEFVLINIILINYQLLIIISINIALSLSLSFSLSPLSLSLFYVPHYHTLHIGLLK